MRMKSINVSQLSGGKYSFEVNGPSYVGRPKDHTVMYVAKKIEATISNLLGRKACLVFIEDGISVPEELEKENCFIRTKTPQKDYADFVSQWAEEIEQRDRCRKYCLQENGAFLGENVTLGSSVWIEPGCVIGHDVVIGDHAHIHSGARLFHCKVGAGFVAGENCTIGTEAFILTMDMDKNLIHMPSLGQVIIGDHVEIGPHVTVSRGTAGDTVIDDYVKIDALSCISHDDVLHRNVEVAGGVTIGGFVELKERAFVGIHAVLRNRITVGENAFVGMGAVVTKNVQPGVTVVGNPAKPFHRK